MNTDNIPGIIQQRWAAACEAPSIQQWRSLGAWIENFADLCAAYPNTRPLVPQLREMADEARRNMVALQPERECEAAHA
jgi:hypothetical protein